jgi:CrcB protein
MSAITASAPAPAVRRHHVLLAVFVGGAIGTLGRAAMSRLLVHGPASWPWSTFTVNMVACLLLGWWATRVLRSPDIDPRIRPLLATGICGGLSTFATLQVELVRMLQHHAWGLAVAYEVVTIAGGLASIMLGRAAAIAVQERAAP